MRSIKGKVLIIFFLSTISISSLAYYSWFTLQKISGKVGELSSPDVKEGLFKQLSSDIIRLNNIYSSYQTYDSLEIMEMHQPVIQDIKNTIYAIKKEYGLRDTVALQTLDSIPYLLDVIEKELLALQLARRNNSKKFVSKLIKTLNNEINEYQDKDSAYVVNQVQILLFSRKEAAKQEEGDKRNGFSKFFNNLFSKKQKDKEDDRERDPDQTVDTYEQVEVFTDSIPVIQHNEMLRNNILEVILDLYTEEMEKLRGLNKLEKEIHAKNTLLIHEIEKAISTFRENEITLKQNSIEETIVFTDTFSKVIRNLIFLFTLLSIILLFLLLKDLNKGKFYQLQLMREREQAEKAAESKHRFLAMMSHELRTPLTSIIGYADLMENKDDHIKAIKSSSEHLLKVANEVLDLAKFESGNIELQKENINLIQVLQDIRINFEVLIQNKNLKGIFDFPEGPLWVSADPYRIYQILFNLLNNSLKFTQNGFIRLCVNYLEDKDNLIKIKIQVEDSGLGIASDDQDKIFEDFKQSGTHTGKQGTGLGLGIVKKVAQLMGGDISLKSELGKGTLIELEFAFEKVTEKVEEIEENTNYPSLTFSSKKIFVIDDDPLIVKLYKSTLEPLGADIKLSTDPHEALKHLQSHSYDLVITDMNMPGLSGLDLLEKLSSDDVRPKKIMCATADILANEDDKKALAGFDAVLYKPIRKKDLLKHLACLLNLENEATFSQVTEPVNETEDMAFDLSSIKEYAMEDESLLKELISDLYEHNLSEIKNAFKNLEAKDYKAVASSVHKLAARFGQINVQPPVDTRGLEAQLKNGDHPPFEETRLLLSFWEETNDKFGEKYLYA